MEQVELSRYEIGGILGSGADYEVRLATDRNTGQEVVLKRPEPQMTQRLLHEGIEKRTDRILQVYAEIGHTIQSVSPILGYTDRENHDASFGDNLEHEYRVIVEARAPGIPLVDDPKARIRGVPIGVGQNLFALFPLVQPVNQDSFAVLRQLVDVEEQFVQAGYVLLDLRPQNVFYQPASGRITVIDSGALTQIGVESAGSRGRAPSDVYDFYLEMLKFYTTLQLPPEEVSGYKDPSGLRPVMNFEQELDQMIHELHSVPDQAVRDKAEVLMSSVRDRAYIDVADFRHDLLAYLEAVGRSYEMLPNIELARQIWFEALDWLRQAHWQRYRFDAETELSTLSY